MHESTGQSASTHAGSGPAAVDFDGVRIFADEERAARASLASVARAVTALALTAGSSANLSRRGFAPAQEAGRRLRMYQLAPVPLREDVPSLSEWHASELAIAGGPTAPGELIAPGEVTAPGEPAVGSSDAEPPPIRVEEPAALLPLAPPPASTSLVLRTPPSALDALIAAVGTAIDSATAPPAKEKQSSKQLARAHEKARARARHSALRALAAHVGKNLPERAVLDALLDDKSVSQEDKVATLGRTAVLLVRIKLLLEWMYRGGVPGGDDGKKKNKKGSDDLVKSKGAFPAPQPRETIFALDRAALVVRGRGDWRKLARALDASDTAVARELEKKKVKKKAPEVARRKAEGRAEALAGFIAAHGEPQPGDIVVIRRKKEDAAGAHSHAMVERYDPITATVAALEVNAGAAVRSRKLVLSKPKDVARIVHLARPGVEHYRHGAPAPSTLARAPATPDMDTQEALLSSVRSVVEKLVKLASERGWIQSADPNVPAFEWLIGPAAGDAGTSTE
jgi:hypothetical protein